MSAACNCIQEVNAGLADRNGELLITIWPVSRPIIETAKLNATFRVKPPMVVATFCPFCGAKYPEIAA